MPIWRTQDTLLGRFIGSFSFCIIKSFLQLLDMCLRLGSKDNMTALVVKFKAQKIGEGGGVMARRVERDDRMNENEDRAEESSK
jgi:hypothetical protein